MEYEIGIIEQEERMRRREIESEKNVSNGNELYSNSFFKPQHDNHFVIYKKNNKDFL